jgi:hypothetical protein
MNTPLPEFKSVPVSVTENSLYTLNCTVPRFARSFFTGEFIDVLGNSFYEKLVAAHQLRVEKEYETGKTPKHPLLPIKCVTTSEVAKVEAENRSLREATFDQAVSITLSGNDPPHKKARHLHLVKG